MQVAQEIVKFTHAVWKKLSQNATIWSQSGALSSLQHHIICSSYMFSLLHEIVTRNLSTILYVLGGGKHPFGQM